MKDLFQTERPSILNEWTGGVPIRESLNVEFAIVLERVADLVFLLGNDTLLHLDFQSDNDPDMATRVGIYGLMIHQKFKRKVRQIVLFTGEPRLNMDDYLNIGTVTVTYDLVDIRDYDADRLLATGNPGDLVLALLAKDGIEKMTRILREAAALEPHQRQRVLTQMAIFSGLRGASEELRIEVKRMGLTIDIDKNAFLREIRDDAEAKGRADAKAEVAAIVTGMIAARFGQVPGWATARIAAAGVDELLRIANRMGNSATVEAAFRD